MIIKSPVDGATLLEIDSFTFSNFYGAVKSNVPDSSHIFGLGERAHNFILEDGIYTMWALDNPAEYDEARINGNQGYGVHPVYFARRGNGNYFGVLNLNANAQRVTLRTAEGRREIEHEITGGIYDFFIFTDNDETNNTANDAIKRYHRLIGKPLLPPFWSLGWQQTRYGYDTIEEF